jgi:AcrR family transcriptional regulator
MQSSATPKISTSDRILDAALALFNERGAAHVTTADIAAAAAMREGNLHYHFRRKEQLVEALFARFQDDEIATAEQRLADPSDPKSYTAYQAGWFALMWRYRCFYRDATTLFAQAPSLRAPFAETQSRARQAVQAVAAQAIANGLMRATPAQIERLVTNVWIVSSYWMEYWAANTGLGTLQPDDLAWGLRQIESLYEPYMIV